jgi:uncharacterized membrane protein
MSEIALAKINSFASEAMQADFEPPSEESVFVLTSSQLQEVIRQATAPILQELHALRATQEADIERLALDIALDRQRLARLEKIEPQPLQRDRGEILRALIAANGGKMLAKEARQKMHLSRSRFSELLTVMHEDLEVKPYHLSKRQNVLVLK